MPEVVHRSVQEQVRSVDDENRKITFIISTFDLDSYNTRIDQDGWDFSVFAKNPVICLQHDADGYSQTNGLPIGKGIVPSITIKNQQTFMDVEFPPEGDFPIADTVYKLAKGGFINAGSVGFEPLEWEDVDETAEDGTVRKVRIYRKQRLLEFSVVTLPANSNALIQRAHSQNADVNEVRGIAETLEKLVRESASEKYTPEFIEKCVRYFEIKQPANKVATKVLKAFFANVLKEKQPDDEVKAWERMLEGVEAIHERTEDETPITGTTQAPAKVEVVAEEESIVEEEVKPETAEEPDKQPTPTPEAPERTRKASVQIPVSTLRELPRLLRETMKEAAAEALRQGYPKSELPGFLDSVGQKLAASIISPPSV